MSKKSSNISSWIAIAASIGEDISNNSINS